MYSKILPQLTVGEGLTSLTSQSIKSSSLPPTSLHSSLLLCPSQAMSSMDSGLIAGSYQRNELHVMHGHEEVKGHTGKPSVVKTCRVCGDEIAVKENGEVFVACHECGFPVCRPCYEYERSEGNQCCPQCNTRYKRHKGNLHYVLLCFNIKVYVRARVAYAPEFIRS